MKPCRKCGSTIFKTRTVTFKNGTNHLERRCEQCDLFLDFMPQDMPPGKFVMPFGRHKGKPLQEIVDRDQFYARYLWQTAPRSSIGKRVGILLGVTAAEEEKYSTALPKKQCQNIET